MTRWIVCPISLLLLTAQHFRPAPPPAPDRLTFRGRTLGAWSAGLHDADPRVRSVSATALGLGGFGKAALPPLLFALRDREEDVRKSAMIALGNLGPDAAEAVPPWDASRPEPLVTSLK